ncbi:MAG: hypothetical protein ACRDHL_05550, partial [Candidatus Promineifilaceae bacterium]
PSPGATPSAPAATAEPGEVEDQIALQPGSLETGALAASTIHRWPLEATAGEVITLQVAAELGLEVSLVILAADGQTVAESHGATPGQPEVIAGVSLPTAGPFEVRVSAPGPGHYAIMLLDAGSYPFVFQGTLAQGDSHGALLGAETDHIWHFSGQAGDVLNLTAAPDGPAGDPFLRLYGPDGLVLVGLHNESPAGQPESLAAYTLPAEGLYSLVVGELSFAAMQYELFVAPD